MWQFALFDLAPPAGCARTGVVALWSGPTRDQELAGPGSWASGQPDARIAAAVQAEDLFDGDLGDCGAEVDRVTLPIKAVDLLLRAARVPELPMEAGAQDSV
jgi:hypothetical protein